MTALRVVVTALCAVVLIVAIVLLGVAITISRTVLEPEFVIAQLDGVPVHEFFAAEAKKQVPKEAEFLLPIIDEASVDLEPWAREQIAVIIEAVETYVKGEGEFRAVLAMEVPKEYLIERVGEVLLDSFLPGGQTLTQEQLDAFAAAVRQEADKRIPDLFTVTEEFLEPEMVEGLQLGRQAAGYVDMSLWLLPAVAVVALVLLALSLRWNGKSIVRGIGATFLAAGIAAVVLGLVMRSMLPGAISQGLPAEIAAAMPGIVANVSEPMFIYGVGVGVVGVVLVGVSLLLRTSNTAG
jgi:hypothetical protein